MTGSLVHRDSIKTKMAKKNKESGMGQTRIFGDAKLESMRTTDRV